MDQAERDLWTELVLAIRHAIAEETNCSHGLVDTVAAVAAREAWGVLRGKE